MNITERCVLIFIEKRIRRIFKTPRMWGDLESIEFQILTLLDMYCFVRMKNINITHDYVKFLNARFTRDFNGYLSGHLKDIFSEDVYHDDFCVDVLVHSLEDYCKYILVN